MSVPFFTARNERRRCGAASTKNKTKENAGGQFRQAERNAVSHFFSVTIRVDARQRRDDGDGLLGLLARRGLLRGRRRRRRDFGHGGFCGRGHIRSVRNSWSLGGVRKVGRVLEEEEEKEVEEVEK